MVNYRDLLDIPAIDWTAPEDRFSAEPVVRAAGRPVAAPPKERKSDIGVVMADGYICASRTKPSKWNLPCPWSGAGHVVRKMGLDGLGRQRVQCRKCKRTATLLRSGKVKGWGE